MTIFLILLIVIMLFSIFDLKKQNENLFLDNSKLAKAFMRSEEANKELYLSLIKAEKAAQEAEEHARNMDKELQEWKRKFDVKAQLLAQFERIGNE